ncbi:MAG: tRNA (N(6)-L-threonylcarbamoyladenosine(37)-C(2))-methylthiotransferase MtaB, partial [Pseudomonadota bacterium]
YSPRPGTPAARMPQVEKPIIKDRAARLRALGETALNRFLASKVGSTESALVEKDGVARTEQFAMVAFEGALPPGAMANFAITGQAGGQLTGKAVA